MNTLPILPEDSYLITSQSQFLEKLNELITNGYSYTEYNHNTDTLILDVSKWGDGDLQYERILTEQFFVDILYFKVYEEHKVFEVCTNRFRTNGNIWYNPK